MGNGFVIEPPGRHRRLIAVPGAQGHRWRQGSERRSAVGGPALGDVLAVARAVDVDVDRVHGEAVEDRGGEGSVAEEAAPVAERDVRGDGGGDAGVPPIDEVVEV
jgi:hypothetical protein